MHVGSGLGLTSWGAKPHTKSKAGPSEHRCPRPCPFLLAVPQTQSVPGLERGQDEQSPAGLLQAPGLGELGAAAETTQPAPPPAAHWQHSATCLSSSSPCSSSKHRRQWGHCRSPWPLRAAPGRPPSAGASSHWDPAPGRWPAGTAKSNASASKYLGLLLPLRSWQVPGSRKSCEKQRSIHRAVLGTAILGLGLTCPSPCFLLGPEPRRGCAP